MKKFFYLLVVISMIFVSCQKNEQDFAPVPETVVDKSVDTVAAKTKMLATSIPSKEEVQKKITEQNKLKDANVGLVMVRIFSLDPNTYEVYEDHAIKHLVYYELNQSAYRTKFLMLNQTFPITDGIVDTTQYQLDINVGCPFSRFFQLKDQNYLNQLTFFFHFNNGEEFAYIGDNGSSSVKLPPIAGGQWQIDIVYNDGDMRQEFMSNLINFYGDDLITLKFNIAQESNLRLEINKSFLDVVSNPSTIELVGKDSEGNFQYFLYPINLDGFGDVISFPIPFYITRIYVCGDNGCYAYSMLDVVPEYDMKTGNTTYRL